MRNAPTAQLCVFANRLARPWMQYATSARGLVAETAEKIASKRKQDIDSASVQIDQFFLLDVDQK